jgi:hypothetical protein
MTVSEWIEQYRKLSGRFETMKTALELLHKNNGFRIVETGTTRMKNDWGAGMSTLIFGSYCKEFGGHVTTVDISQDNMNVCREVTKEFEKYIDYIVVDSISYLTLMPTGVDLLYLDSVDCPIEILTPQDTVNLNISQKHQLQEITTALPKVNGIVLLDDNGFTLNEECILFPHGGKTLLSKEYLSEQGWKEIMGGQQSLWSKII